MIEIVKTFPPNIDEIDRTFHVRDQAGVLYCFGGKLYNPSGGHVPPQIIAHEEVHSDRQTCHYWKAKDGREWTNWCPDLWWQRYIYEPEFRLSEELFAHRAEYDAFCKLTKNRKMRRDYLSEISKRLSGPLYDGMVSYQKAMKLITSAAVSDGGRSF